MNIDVSKILPNPEQPRKEFDQAELAGLAESIKQNGVINPICVEDAGEKYILIDGERRWRAAKMVGLEKIPAQVRPPMNGDGKRTRLIMALVANMQRADLNPIEEAEAFCEMKAIGMSHVDIGFWLGISYAKVAQRVKLLKLDNEIQELLRGGKMSADPRVIDALQGIPDRAARVKLANRFAGGKTTIKTFISACEKVREMLEEQKVIDADEAKAVLVARSKTEPRDGHPARWNALKQAGSVPPWELVVKSTEAVCRSCSLYDMASPKVCQDCPLVVMLVRLMEAAA